jgi:glutamate N-acetyltransferase/amino-acid N-acetyltransferase
VQEIDGGILAADGFRAAGVACGIRESSARDVCLVAADERCSAAGTFTTSAFASPPVHVCREHLHDGQAQAIVSNSGNANAATGERGLADARRMAEIAAQAVGVPVGDVLVASTGKIGVPLPMGKIESGIRAAAQRLGRDGATEAAEAMLTTDTVAKQCAVETEIGGTAVRLGGMCKGAGMIRPDMATMHCFLSTDARLGPAALSAALRHAVGVSFNCISVDGDMSTSDTVLILAGGWAGGDEIPASGEAFVAFRGALVHVCQSLARQIVRDGEGATKLVEIRVTGAESWEAARQVGRTVGDSLLVKTAIHGRDFNWGRIAAAVGAAGVPVNQSEVSITIGGLAALRNGRPAEVSESDGDAAMAGDEVCIEIDLASGPEAATVWTCDLSAEYVTFNAKYTT